MTGLRITAVGNEIAVKEGSTQWHADSGQLLIDFEVEPGQGTANVLAVKLLPPAPEPARARGRRRAPGSSAASSWKRATGPGPNCAYRRAIGAAPDYVDPYLNLGVMLCEAGRCDEAIALYRASPAALPRTSRCCTSTSRVALEDSERIEEALACYERCLQLAPDFADAHYNAARLHEQLGHATKAIRHYSEYRRLQP